MVIRIKLEKMGRGFWVSRWLCLFLTMAPHFYSRIVAVPFLESLLLSPLPFSLHSFDRSLCNRLLRARHRPPLGENCGTTFLPYGWSAQKEDALRFSSWASAIAGNFKMMPKCSFLLFMLHRALCCPSLICFLLQRALFFTLPKWCANNLLIPSHLQSERFAHLHFFPSKGEKTHRWTVSFGLMLFI